MRFFLVATCNRPKVWMYRFLDAHVAMEFDFICSPLFEAFRTRPDPIDTMRGAMQDAAKAVRARRASRRRKTKRRAPSRSKTT